MQMIFPDGTDGHALKVKGEDILPQPISMLIKKGLTIKCVPFEGKLTDTKGTILIAFQPE